MVNNKQLKESLQLLLQKVFSLYETELHMNDSLQNELPYVAIELHKVDKKVLEIPEFKICLGFMEKDDKIKVLQGQLVGSYSYRGNIRDEETCILSFVKQIYLESQKYDQDLFDQKYLAFENLFYSDFLEFRDSAKLYNFGFNENELAFGHGISIRRDTNIITPNENMGEYFMSPVSLFSKSNYLIERDYRTKKIIGEMSQQEESELNSELSRTGTLFDLVINSLRILKPGAVYRDHRINTEDKTFHPMSGRQTRFSHFENVTVGQACNIETADIADLRRVFDYLISEKDSRFSVARRRLSLGVERRNPEDRLIDYMIGLETLYLPDGNAELSFRLSLRVAFLLFSGTEKMNTFNFLRRMYDVRSSIVHGSKYDLITEDINKLEELLRKSIMLWIENESIFSKDQLNKILFDA